MSGLDRIAAERRRQISTEGWTAEHDNTHVDGEMWRAAACYLFGPDDSVTEECWPWHKSWYKPSSDRIRELEKAGALIAAEIDRLERLDNSAAGRYETLKGAVCFADDTDAGIRGGNVGFDTGIDRQAFRDGDADREEWRADLRKLYEQLCDWPCSVHFDDECIECGSHDGSHQDGCPSQAQYHG